MSDDEVFDEPMVEVPLTCLGLPVCTDGQDVGIPLDVFVIAKHLQDGEICYSMLSTRDLTTVEGLGMLRFATIRIEAVIGGYVNTEETDPEA